MIVQTSIGHKMEGLYRGTVLKHLNNGRCKIFIEGVFTETDPDKLPDCEQASPIFAGGLNGNGIFSYPDIGTTVLCMFINGDQNFPVYFAQTLGGNVSPNMDMSAKQIYDKCKMEGDHIHKIHVGNSDIEFSENGHINITTRDTASIQKQCIISLNSEGGINIKSDGQITLESPNIVIKSDTLKVKSNIIEFGGKTQEYGSKMEVFNRNILFDTDKGSINKTTLIGLSPL